MMDLLPVSITLALLLAAAMDTPVARILSETDAPDAAAAAAEAGEPVVPRFVLGYAVCDSCWENRVTTNTIFLSSKCPPVEQVLVHFTTLFLFRPCSAKIPRPPAPESVPGKRHVNLTISSPLLPDVSTVFECTDPKGRVVFRHTSSTDRLGSFLVALPLRVAHSVGLLSTCMSRVIKGPVRHRPCHRFSSVRSASPFLSLQPLPDGRLIYGTGPIFFKPRKMHPFCSSSTTRTLPFNGQLFSRASATPSSNPSASQPAASSPPSTSTASSATPSVSSTPSPTISTSGFQFSLSLQISSGSSTPATTAITGGTPSTAVTTSPAAADPASNPSTPASSSSDGGGDDKNTSVTVNPTFSNFTFPAVPTFMFPTPFIPFFPQIPAIPPLPPVPGFPMPALPPLTVSAIPAAVSGPAPQHQRQL